MGRRKKMDYEVLIKIYTKACRCINDNIYVNVCEYVKDSVLEEVDRYVTKNVWNPNRFFKEHIQPIIFDKCFEILHNK